MWVQQHHSDIVTEPFPAAQRADWKLSLPASKWHQRVRFIQGGILVCAIIGASPLGIGLYLRLMRVCADPWSSQGCLEKPEFQDGTAACDRGRELRFLYTTVANADVPSPLRVLRRMWLGLCEAA